jgi:molybdate-binding protein/transcriptional regulator with XRE-family HTH domain
MVRASRERRGWSQHELAARAGLSRAGVSAIETGRLEPSTAAALALSRALDCAVEDLFRLRAAPAAAEAAEGPWAWAPPFPVCRYWRATIGGRSLAYPVEVSPLGTPHDGVCRDGAFDDGPHVDADRALVVACCDPAVGLLADALARAVGVRLIPLVRSSRAALGLLARGLVHAAGVHLARSDDEAGNLDAVREAEPGLGALRLLRLADWEEGIALAPSLSVATFREAVRRPVRWVGREPGSGARACLDEVFREAEGTPPPELGFARDHRGVAAAIRDGWADAGVCIRLAGEEAGLSFLSVRREAYDLCFPEALEADPRLRALVKAVRSAPYRRSLSDLPGYDASATGSLAKARGHRERGPGAT